MLGINLKNIFASKNKDIEDNVQQHRQLGLEIRMPGCKDFVPIGKTQYKRIYADDIGPRLICVLDECAELIEPSGVKTQEGKEEDALKQEIVGLIKSITQLGRSSGMHCILAPLRLSTLIPTVDGYTTMKDIKVGDRIFGSNGLPVNVVAVAPVIMSNGMYEIKLFHEKYGDNCEMTVGSDGQHRFPVMVRGNLEVVEVHRLETLYRQAYNLKILGNDGQLWSVLEVNRIDDEPVRCIEVDSADHLFLIVGEKDEEWKKNPGEKYRGLAICTHNTQRNDASIIPGVIQSNPLSIQTKLRIRRKV